MNNQPHLRFLDCSTGNEHAQIWKWLQGGGYRSLYPCRHEKNILNGVLRRESWRPVLGDWLPVYPGMAWDTSRKQLVERIFKPDPWQGGLTDFIEVVESFFDRFSGRRLGVQLSGGLDSSFITAIVASNRNSTSNKKLCTFSTDVDHQDMSEISYQKIVSEKYNTSHHSHLFDSQDIEKYLNYSIPKD